MIPRTISHLETMANDVFETIFKEQVDVFKASFAATSREVFFDPERQRLFHTGEFGAYRENVVRDFLKFIVPRSLDISQGFVITTENDVSTQCDVIAFNAGLTPLYQLGDRQRFFPIESVFSIGEVKSKLSKAEFREAINKLAKVKALSERVQSPTVVKKTTSNPYNPKFDPNDLVSTFLICESLEFSLDNLQNEIATMYESNVEHRHMHNMILSLKDGLLAYANTDGTTLPMPCIGGRNLIHRFSFPTDNAYLHFKLFASYLFMLSASRTQLFPEFVNYVGSIVGGMKRDQTNSLGNFAHDLTPQKSE